MDEGPADRFDLEHPVTRDEILRFRAESKRARRERIATAALQGLLADYEPNSTYEVTADVAVKFADALIARLDRD